jgi:hypothetical protein
MASRVYSTRFILIDSLNGSTAYVVPAGKRAVVREMDAIARSAGGANVYLYVAGVAIVNDNIPGTGTGYTQWRGEVVARAGETIQVTTTLSCNVYCGGFLLDDP